MSFRINLVASSALMFVSLCGAASVAGAADTQAVVVGHPGKSIQLPKRERRQESQHSRVERKPLILASYTDAPGGIALVRGRTERALELINAKTSNSPSISGLTNRCVAHTVLRQWSQAGDACDAAVVLATRKRTDARGLAAAYSNRAVMHWLSRNETAAYSDLAKARTLAPKASYVTRNLAATERGASLAQAADDRAPIG
jgi:hypothetical protein